MKGPWAQAHRRRCTRCGQWAPWHLTRHTPRGVICHACTPTEGDTP